MNGLDTVKNKTKIPIISTRGIYRLRDGRRQTSKRYSIVNKGLLRKKNCPELVVVVHGFRNTPNDALRKFKIVKHRLKNLNYKYPVVGYSYGANVAGASKPETEIKALKTGQKIARRNGYNLAEFILDYKKECKDTKIRLVGHSLGAYVILHALLQISKKQRIKHQIESVHLFGAAIDNKIPCKNNTTGEKISRSVKRKIVNYYAPTDEVLGDPTSKKLLSGPLGLTGASKGKKIPNYSEKKVIPKNHRFVSYMQALKKFP